MVLRNFLDEKVFFLKQAIILTCFQSEKSQNKLDLMLSFLLKRFTIPVKIWNADRLLEDFSDNNHENIVNYKLRHLDDVIFKILVFRIRVLLHK